MRLLAIADPHGDYSKIETIMQKAGSIDAVLIAGDITEFGPEERAEELINMFDEPVLAVPGNCDPREILEVLDRSKAINLHDSCTSIGNVTFIGIGGSNPTPFETPFEIHEDEIESCLIRSFDEQERKKGTRVLLSHAPPHCTLDEIPAGNVGCKAIRKFVEKVDLVVCAHIHEARGVMKEGNTIIVNPGMAKEGNAAIITIDEEAESEKINVELIKV